MEDRPVLSQCETSEQASQRLREALAEAVLNLEELSERASQSARRARELIGSI